MNSMKILFFALSLNLGFSNRLYSAENVVIGESSLAPKLAICQQVYDEGLSMNIELPMACPMVSKYTFRTFSIQAMKKYFAKHSGHNLREVGLKKGVRTIINSLRDQTGDSMTENLTAGEEEREMLLVLKMRKAVSTMEKMLLTAGKNARVFVDENTYWAPSVNARVLLFVYPEKGTVTEIIHGDIDG